MALMNSDRVMGLLQEAFARKEGMKMVLEELMREAMEAEVEEHVGAGRHERTEERNGHRNGYKPRSFKTRVGE
jgi:transposase-like protein